MFESDNRREEEMRFDRGPIHTIGLSFGKFSVDNISEFDARWIIQELMNLGIEEDV